MTLLDFVRRHLEEIETEKGFFYKIIISQKNKKTAIKKMRLYHRKVRKKLRIKGKYYSVERATWITINAVKRMKSFWGFHKGKAKIRIEKL